MYKKFFVKQLFVLACALIASTSFFAVNSDAQTKRRKTHKKIVRTIPTSIPVQTPVDTSAAIVSRADDFQNENRTLEPEPETIQPPAQIENAQPNANSDSRFSEINTRIKNLESKPANEYDQKQKRLLLNLDILTRAETRAESLRKQLFEMIEKESQIREKLDQIQNDSRSENIDRAVAFAGTLRPEELRDTRAKNLASEKTNLENLLTQIQETRTNIETNVLRADQLVEKLRTKLEKDIDDALVEEPKN